MTAENLLLLGASVLLSAGRNAVSKRTAVDMTDKRGFFLSQTVLFLSAALLLGAGSLRAPRTSGITLLYGVIYGVLLVLAQWMLTVSLARGNTSLCSVVYSLGFVLPTLSGALFWKESFTVRDGVGLALAVTVILLSAKREKETRSSPMPYILIAMLASGGLGIMQKVQQTSSAPEEKGVFLLVAFLVATLASLTAFLCCKREEAPHRTPLVAPVLTGLCFGGANLCNTVLAGAMKSAVVFPTQNIGTVLLSTVLGMALFGEKMTLKTAVVLFFCIITVLVFAF